MTIVITVFAIITRNAIITCDNCRNISSIRFQKQPVAIDCSIAECLEDIVQKTMFL